MRQEIINGRHFFDFQGDYNVTNLTPNAKAYLLDMWIYEKEQYKIFKEEIKRNNYLEECDDVRNAILKLRYHVGKCLKYGEEIGEKTEFDGVKIFDDKIVIER